MLKAIKVRPEVFQHRRPAKHVSERHIRSLADAVRSRGALTPLTVWWDGKHWSCIDGHHRVQAYLRAGMQQDVPVEVFEGTPEQALARAADANTKDKLQMPLSEKANAGWRLVVMARGLSRARQAEAADLFSRQIAYMRATKAKLIAGGHDSEALSEMTWEQARRTAAGVDIPSGPKKTRRSGSRRWSAACGRPLEHSGAPARHLHAGDRGVQPDACQGSRGAVRVGLA
jgi:hypothetical protein